MFASGRSLLPNSNLLAIWNFDGNLLNFSSGTGLNGSFNTGTTNNARLSGFLNESSPGAYGTGFISHATVINRGGTPNSFPNGFYKSAPFMTIPDNNTTGVTNTIIISNNSGNVANIEVFISVQHTWIGDLVLTLTAPNGQSRTIISNNGGAGDNILSFFGDAFNYLPSSAIYLPPWGFIKPIVNFGNIGNSVINGTWTLKAVDNAGGDQGVLQGWGLRFNNQTMVGTEQISSNLPDRFTLYQNYPNPFNPKTTIRFDLAANSRMKIVLFDLLGREILTIAEGEYKAGSYKSEFDASMLSSGVYFYKITAGDFTDTKKMMLVK
jgi:subtilisin-like proprotein convertase family protein